MRSKCPHKDRKMRTIWLVFTVRVGAAVRAKVRFRLRFK